MGFVGYGIPAISDAYMGSLNSPSVATGKL